MQNVHGCITRTNPKSASLWVCISDSCGPSPFCSELMWARYINTKNPRTQSLQHGLSDANSVHGYPLDPKCNTKMTRGSRRHCTVTNYCCCCKKEQQLFSRQQYPLGVDGVLPAERKHRSTACLLCVCNYMHVVSYLIIFITFKSSDRHHDFSLHCVTLLLWTWT